MVEFPLQTRVLLQRYGELRTEIRQRIDSRYKLLQVGMSLSVAAIGAIFGFEVYVLGFTGCAFTLVLLYLLFTEIRAMSTIVQYMISIEEVVDEECELPIKGWERYLYKIRHENNSGQRWQNFGIWFTFIVFYSSFNVLGCIALHSPWCFIAFVIIEVFGVIFARSISPKFYPQTSPENTS